ncbi:MAG TPA: IPT/TIG domain-containing protein [Gemmataceae bacterium]|nr:IPT/TIG domain-containing protein [Gemmataceae bacterium]
MTSVVPNTGPTTGGNVVTINGTFAGSGDTVLFGTTAATITNDTTTSITVIAPAGAAGTVDVTVDGSAVNAADKYTYVAPSSPPGPPSPPGSSSSAPPSVNAPPLLGLINLFFHGAETVNANGTETVTYSLYGFTFLTATYNSDGGFVSGALFGITLPNFIWSL